MMLGLNIRLYLIESTHLFFYRKGMLKVMYRCITNELLLNK